MGVTRSDLFTDEQNTFAQIAKSLAHPARVAIIEQLLNTNACINSTLVEELGLAQATISQHLRELKDVGIIQGNIEGTSVSYCIHPTNWKKFQEKFEELFRKYKHPDLDQCC